MPCSLGGPVQPFGERRMIIGQRGLSIGLPSRAAFWMRRISPYALGIYVVSYLGAFGIALQSSPVHRSSHVFVARAVGGVTTTHVGFALGLVLDKADLVAVTGVEKRQLGVVHGARDRTLRNLEAVDVQDREDRTRLGRVDPLVRASIVHDRE